MSLIYNQPKIITPRGTKARSCGARQTLRVLREHDHLARLYSTCSFSCIDKDFGGRGAQEFRNGKSSDVYETVQALTKHGNRRRILAG